MALIQVILSHLNQTLNKGRERNMSCSGSAPDENYGSGQIVNPSLIYCSGIDPMLTQNKWGPHPITISGSIARVGPYSPSYVPLSNYQNECGKTAVYPGKGDLTGLQYVVLGLVGEAGEIAQKLKKQIRDRAGVIDESFKENMMMEIGDCLWYIAQLCTELGLNLDAVANRNIEKLRARMLANTIKGDGDNR